jgi:hypothetical protein
MLHFVAEQSKYSSNCEAVVLHEIIITIQITRPHQETELMTTDRCPPLVNKNHPFPNLSILSTMEWG